MSSEQTREYAVFGPGWGNDYLSVNTSFGSGHIAYRGESFSRARTTLREEQAVIARLRRLEHMRHVASTYAIYWRDDDHDWTPLTEAEGLEDPEEP